MVTLVIISHIKILDITNVILFIAGFSVLYPVVFNTIYKAQSTNFAFYYLSEI